MQTKNPRTTPIDNDELERELLAYQASGPDRDSRRASERLGQIILDLHDNILRHKNFNRYPQEVKEDMKSGSVERVFRWALSGWKKEKGFKAFSYLTRCIFQNYINTAMRYYRRINAKRLWYKAQLEELGAAGSQRAWRAAKEFRTYEEDVRDD